MKISSLEKKIITQSPRSLLAAAGNTVKWRCLEITQQKLLPSTWHAMTSPFPVSTTSQTRYYQNLRDFLKEHIRSPLEGVSAFGYTSDIWTSSDGTICVSSVCTSSWSCLWVYLGLSTRYLSNLSAHQRTVLEKFLSVLTSFEELAWGGGLSYARTFTIKRTHSPAVIRSESVTENKQKMP